MTKRILIGKVATAHGIKGDVKVLCYADDAELLFRESGVFTDETTQKRVVLSFKSEPKHNLFIATMEGVSDRTAAERARNVSFYIDREDLPEADDGALYHSDLENMSVVTPDGKTLGKVLRVQNFGAGDLLEIQNKGELFFLPYAAPYLVSVDEKSRVITMNEPEVM